MRNFRKKQLLVIFIFSTNILRAQDTSVPPSSLEVVSIELNNISRNSTAILLPFRKIKVLDIRADSGKLGFVAVGRKFKQICLSQRNDSSIQSYFNRNYISSGIPTYPDLLIVLKSFWLKDFIADDPFQKKSLDVKFHSQCVIKMDVFIGNEHSYKSFLRIDTSLNYEYVLRKNVDQVFSISADYVFERINTSLNSISLSTRKEIVPENIYSYYKKYNNQPRILNDNLEKGIYVTFKDFLNNRPEHTDFTIEDDKKGSLLYTIQNGEKVLMNTIWGYCDGTGHFIKIGNRFFKLSRFQNAYYLWGFNHEIFKGTSSNSENPLSFGQSIPLEMYRGSLHGKFVNPIRPMVVDMETGKVL